MSVLRNAYESILLSVYELPDRRTIQKGRNDHAGRATAVTLTDRFLKWASAGNRKSPSLMDKEVKGSASRFGKPAVGASHSTIHSGRDAGAFYIGAFPDWSTPATREHPCGLSARSIRGSAHLLCVTSAAQAPTVNCYGQN